MPHFDQLVLPAPSTLAPTARAALCRHLHRLYRRQMAEGNSEVYLVGHSQPACVINQVRTFQWYFPQMPTSGTILDWGCKHAPDSCLLRAVGGDNYELHGCDFFAPDTYAVFHDNAGLHYTQLDEVSELPYASESFDVVIASGVLEHVAQDYESLKELYRLLKPNGLLAITYLPNRWSVAEWRRRELLRCDFHRRRYSRREIHQLLLHSGFYPMLSAYQSFFWERLLEAAGLRLWERQLGTALRRVCPIHVFSSVLCVLAQKLQVM